MVVASLAILAPVTLAEVGALHALLEALAVLLATARLAAVAPLEVPVCSLLLVDVLKDLSALGEQVCVLVIFLAQF